MRVLRIPAIALGGILVLVAAYMLVRDDGAPLLPGGTLPDLPEPAPGFTLEQNQPNPFRDVTAIVYQIPEEARVTLRIYNTLGAPVRTLVDEVQPAAFHEVEWDGRDANGNRLPAGVFFYQLSAGARRELGRMVMLP